jgi:serine protease Do
MEMIQTDAALNEGNSGGGLFDSQGCLAGIVAAKDSDSSSEGLGFAIPADAAKSVLNDIIAYGYVKGRPSLGISTADITSKAEARYYGVDWIGVYISSVNVGESGDIAGLEPLDYIYSVNEEVITTTNRLNEILSNCNVGDKIIMEIWRGSTSLDVVLVVGEDKG